jgi:hypothetical protein
MDPFLPVLEGNPFFFFLVPSFLSFSLFYLKNKKKKRLSKILARSNNFIGPMKTKKRGQWEEMSGVRSV